MLQPDLGQTMLIALVWGGARSSWPGCTCSGCSASAASACVGLFAAYTLLPHVAARIDRFMDPATGDTFQVDNAIESFVQGGWLGQGPGRGHGEAHPARRHTDFIFAVDGGGVRHHRVPCAGRLCSRFIVLRGLVLSRRNEEPFCRLAAAGLVMLFGLQSVINMAVNVAPDAGQGHDAAVHLLWRLLADLAGARDGLPAGR